MQKTFQNISIPKLPVFTTEEGIKQIRNNLGFEGSPIILLWRGKQQRALDKEMARKNLEIIQKD